MKAWAYKDFKIEQLFDIATTKRKFNANAVSFNGRYPYVVRTSENNGIRGYIEEDEQYLNAGNTISFGQDTATIFYQEKPYFTGDKIKILTPKFEINAEIASYFLTCMRKSFSSFQWGVTSFNVAAINAINVSLPVNKSGEIDFAYMQARIQEMEQARIQEMDTYLKVAGFEDCELTEDEKEAVERFPSQKLCPFVIETLFDIKKGKRLTKEDMIPGEINFIGSTASNNGITAHISNNSHLHNGNKITVSYNGSVGEAFYQSERFWASDDVNVLYSKHSINETLALFFCTALRKSGKKYGYNYKWTKELMSADTINLPVSPSGQIDYKFMETYIRAQEKLAIQRVKNWRAKEIEATKEVVNAEQNQAEKPILHLIISSSEISPSQHYITHLPVYPLRAACGYFDTNGSLPEEEAEGWIDVSAQMNRLDKGMFIVHAEGQSMEPKIHDGDLCVFSSPVVGSRQGKIVLVKAQDKSDPDASSYTIKKYSSEKIADENGSWHHTRITLSPLNPDFHPIILNADEAEEGEFRIYGEFLQTIEV